MEEFRNDLDKIKLFLVNFSKDHCQKLSQDDPLPHRLLSFFLIEKEVEAEVMDWILQYLTAQKAPNLLSTLVAREVVKAVLEWDLKTYLEPLPSSQEEGEGEGGSAGGDSDTDILEDVENDGTPKIEVIKLARDVFNKVHEICKEWAENLPEFLLNTTLPQDKSPIVAISVHAIRNTRRKMEDRHLVMPYLAQQFQLKDSPYQALFTVFDGHGGTEAAIYSAAHLHFHMVRHEAFTHDPVMAIRQSYTHTDTGFIEKAKREHLRSGSTCVSTLLRGDKLYVSWLGDSQVMLVRDGQPQQLMDPHKPEREDERKRIESQGGFVMWFGQWRVNATLSVSRAIGDAEFKPFVCADPDINVVTLTGEEDYIILGCDGLWDTMSFDDVANDIYKFLEIEDKKADVAKMLSQRAKEKGSGDNISIIVVFLKDKLSKPRPMEKAEEKMVQKVPEESGDATEETKTTDGDEKEEKKTESSDQSDTQNKGGSKTQNVPGETGICGDVESFNQTDTHKEGGNNTQNASGGSNTHNPSGGSNTHNPSGGSEYARTLIDDKSLLDKGKENIHQTHTENGKHTHNALEEADHIEKVHHTRSPLDEVEHAHVDQTHTTPEAVHITQSTAEETEKLMAKVSSKSSSSTEPFGTIGGIHHRKQVTSTFKKPVPYNVYKVLLKHQHYHSKYRSQLVEKRNSKSCEADSKSTSMDQQMQQVDSTDRDTPDILVVEEGKQKMSPELSNKQGNISTQATKYLCLSEKRSNDTNSSCHIHLDSSTKSIVSASRKANKKAKNGKKRNLHRDLRRLSRDRLSLGIAERARSSNSSGSSPRSFHHQFVRKKFLTPQYKPAATASSSATVGQGGGNMSSNNTKANRVNNLPLERQGSSIIKGKNSTGGSGVVLNEGIVGRGLTNRKWEGEPLTGMTSSFGFMDLSPTSGASKWTVAREIENAAAMFGE